MATAVATSVPQVLIHPPASPFAELLRRSRFATFDPAIRQTYSAPPAYAHRGDWGLKRPIALRRRNAFISLTSFEHPAQFIEWNHAENQVRFIRRIEEMGTRPRIVSGTPWQRSLGKAKTQWLLDSEFCPEEGQETYTRKDNKVNLNELGRKGPGAYGVNRASPTAIMASAKDVHTTPNINAMSRREFIRYLRKLRELRPAFQQHIREHAAKDGNSQLANKTLLELSQNPEAGYHRKFLKEHAAKEFASLDSLKLEQHPHPNAALMYAHPTPLEIAHRTLPQPGIVLNPIYNKHGKAGDKARDRAYVASFGGLAATLKLNKANNKVPLLDVWSEKGIERSKFDESTANMRIAQNNGLLLQVPPRVVGQKAQGLKAVKIQATVTADTEDMNFRRDNPHPPGSPKYIAADSVPDKSAPRDFYMRQKLMKAVNFGKMNLPHEESTDLIATLQTMMVKPDPKDANDL